MNIYLLANKKEYLPVVHKWYKKEWGYLNPGRTNEQLHAKIKSRLNKGKAPCILLGSVEDKIIGTVTLCLDELEELPQIYPWLSSLYVDESYRLKGFGESLVRACLQEARDLGYKEIYLFTDKRKLVSWYKKMGWVYFEELLHRRVSVTVLRFEL